MNDYSDMGTQPMGTDATVIICTHNRADRLASVLADLRTMKLSPGTSWEIIVADNCSTDGTKAVVGRARAASRAPVRYHYEERKGKSYALNSAIALARGKYLLFTDDDVTIDPGWVQAILDVFSTHACIGIGGRTVPLWECPVPKWHALDGPYRLIGAVVQFEQGDTLHEVEGFPYPVGANMAFHKSAFDRYGRFRTDLGPVGRKPVHGEDWDFCQRLLTARERLLYVPTAIVKHPIDGKRISKSYYRWYYFWFGVRSVRCDETCERAVCYCGVPRYLFRKWGQETLRWLVAVDPRRRFYYELQSYKALGVIWEFWRQWRDVKAGRIATPRDVKEVLS